MILPKIEPEPNIAETKLKSNSPTRPQFKPPIIIRIPATQSRALFSIIDLHFYWIYSRFWDLYN